MKSLIALLRANTGLLVMVILLGMGALVFGTFAIALAGSDVSIRPILFVGGLFALVVLPQLAFHLGVALGWIPRRNLTWMPAADQASVYGWVEQEAALAIANGQFSDLAAVFGPGVDATPGADPRAAGATSPFASAEAAYMAVLPPNGSVIVSRFANAAAAGEAARDYARQAIGLWPDTGRDGLRTATRPGGDIVKIAHVGRTLVIVSGAKERPLMKQLLALGAITPAKAPSDPGSEEFWLYRPAVFATLSVLLVASYVFLFFKGAAWASEVDAVAGVQPVAEVELRRRLLAINAADVPFSLGSEEVGSRLVATWRFADARWLDLARARQMTRVQRVLLEFDAESHVVRVTDQMSLFDASAGRGGATVEWRTMSGVTFFQMERGRVFGLQFDEKGKPMPTLDYAWQFDSREMKAPLIDAVTRAGWQWRPTPWSGPTWLKWLTD